MKYKIFYIIVSAVIMVLFCTSCSSENGVVSPSSDYLTVQGAKDVWTYISLSSKTVVGSADMKDPTALDLWKERTDWDIAICNGMIKTNSGTSGNGSCAIKLSTEKDFQVDSIR